MLIDFRGGPPFGGCKLMNSRGEPPILGCILMNSRGGPLILRGGPPLRTISMDQEVPLIVVTKMSLRHVGEFARIATNV